jgi:hypothetical protein
MPFQVKESAGQPLVFMFAAKMVMERPVYAGL